MTNADKPASTPEVREFWLNPNPNNRGWSEGKPDDWIIESTGVIHVIERSAYDQVVRDKKLIEEVCEEKLVNLKAQLAAVTAKHEELLSYLPKVPTQPYEKELAQQLASVTAERDEARQLANDNADPRGGEILRKPPISPCATKSGRHRWGFSYHALGDNIELTSDYVHCVRCKIDKRVYKREKRLAASKLALTKD